MFRTDVFVGVPASSSRGLDQLKYVVSEVEVHSTYGLGNLEQGVGRLWLQGYVDKDYETIPNHEVVPPAGTSSSPSLLEWLHVVVGDAVSAGVALLRARLRQPLGSGELTATNAPSIGLLQRAGEFFYHHVSGRGLPFP